MKYIGLGNSGLKVSRICLGTLSFGSSKWRDWVLEEEESRPFFKMYFRDDDFKVLDHAEELAKKRGCSSAQIALAWMFQKPGVTSPIIGCSKIKHLEESIAALDIMLSDEEIAFLEEPYRPHPVLGL